MESIGEGAGSLMLENRSQNEGNLAAHLHFETKSGSASLLKVPQSLPSGLPNRIKVVKRNNHQRIDELYAFEGGFLVSLDAKMMILSDKFRQQTINCKQMPRVQKHAKTIRFSMILRVRSIGR